MNNKDLDDIIHNSFSANEGGEIPSWDQMKDRLDQKEGIDSLIENSFKNQSLDDIPEVWDEIEKSLIIDATWPKIAAQLDKKKRRRGIFFWIMGPMLLSFLLLFIFEQYGNLYQENRKESSLINLLQESDLDKSFNPDENMQSSNTANQTKKPNPILSKKLNSTLNKENVNKESKKFEKTTRKNRIMKAASANNRIINENNHLEENLVDSDKKQKETNSTEELRKISYFKAKNVQHITNPQIIRIRSNEEKTTRKWTLGLFYELNYDNIYDSKSRIAEQKGSLVDQDFTIGHSFGIYFNRKLKANFMIGGEFHFFDRLSKEFSQFENGKYVEHSLKLDYIRTNIMAGYRLPIRKSSFLEFHAGTFLAYLLAKKETHSDFTDIQQFDHDHYINFNFGLSAKIGMSHDFGRFNFAYGLGTNIGIINIYKSESDIQTKLNRTNTFEAGLYFRFGINL